MQLLKEDAHPSDAGEGNPTVAFQMFERGFERLVFLIRLQRDGRQLDDLCAQLVQPVCHAGNKLLRACQNDPHLVQRTQLGPAELVCQLADLADDQHRRSLNLFLLCALDQGRQGGNHPTLCGTGAFL